MAEINTESVVETDVDVVAEPIAATETVVDQTHKEKLFTQEEVDDIFAKRLARERKGRPSEAEMAEFRQWKSQKQSDAEKMVELTTSLSDAERERDDIAKERDTAAKDRDRYKSDRDKFKTERDKYNAELAEANNKLTQYQRERFLLSKGVPEADLDYYVFKISKEVTPDNPFEKAAESYINDIGGSPVAKLDTGADLSGGAGAPTTNEQMNKLFRQVHKR